MFSLFKKKQTDFLCPMKGRVIPLEEVKDPVFAQKMMGDGYGIEPEEGKVVSPCSGNVSMVYETLHAIGINADSGEEIILHIGLDTVKLGGKPFTCHVEEGRHVNAGELLLEADLEAIEQAGYSTQSCVLFQNLETEVLKIHEHVDAGENGIVRVVKK